jgi:hypothetical protein
MTGNKCVRTWFELIHKEETTFKTPNLLEIQRLQCNSFRCCNDILLIQYIFAFKLLSQAVTYLLAEKKQKLSSSAIPNCFDLFWREYFFFTSRASKRLDFMQNYAINFKIKLNLNVFNAADRTKKCICFSDVWFIA